MHHLEHTRDVLCLELRHVRERSLAVVVLMRLDIRLVLEVDTILIAQVVPVGSGRIVGVAHVVYVRTLHQEDLALHLLMRDGMPTGGIRLVAVRPLELHRLMVDVEVATSVPELILVGWRLADLYLTEARIDGRAIQQRLTSLVIELGDQDIAVGCFCRPECRALERKRRLCRARRAATPFGGSHGSTTHLIGVER